MTAFFKWVARSDIGRKRPNNEDSFGAFPEMGLFFVADGMGGGDDGEVASVATIRAIEEFCSRHPSPDDAAYSAEDLATGVERAANSASEWIYRRASSKKLKGCGSTLVGFCLDRTDPGRAVALHAGDSRLYRIRGRSIRQITRDHSAAEMIGVRDERQMSPLFRGMILRAVGISPTVEIERTEFDIREHDIVLVCSDGLSRMVPDSRIVEIIRASDTTDRAADALITAANEAGGVDNVTAILVEIGTLPPALPRARFRNGGTEPHQGDAPALSAKGDCGRVDSDDTEETDGDAITDDRSSQEGGGATSFTCTSSGLNPLSGRSADDAAVACSRYPARRPDVRLLVRVLEFLVGGLLVASGIAAGYLGWRSHEQDRLRREKMTRERMLRQQENIRRREFISSENARSAAEREKSDAENRRRLEATERQRQADADVARKKAIRDAAERKSAEAARIRRERREREENERRSRSAGAAGDGG